MKSETKGWRYCGEEISIQLIVGWLDIRLEKYDWLGTFDNEPEVINIYNFKPLSRAGVGDVTFCTLQGDEAVKTIMESKASYIVCDHGIANEPPLQNQMFDYKEDGGKRTLMFVDNPRLAYLRILKEFFKPEQCRIELGNCRVDPSAALGMDGFGYERNEKGELELFPHFGNIKIGDRVDLGAYVCVDRATLPDEYTIIGDGCKIDNFVHVAHNVRIRQNVIIVSHCNIGGSVEIGDGSYLAMSVCIKNKVKIGRRCILGNRANIRKDVADGLVVVGDDKVIGQVDEKEEWRKLVGQ